MAAATASVTCWAATPPRPRNAPSLAAPAAAGVPRPPPHASTRLPALPRPHQDVLPCCRASRRGSGGGDALDAQPFRDVDEPSTPASTSSSASSSLSLLVALASTATASLLATALPATAAGLSYDPGAGSDFLKNVAGAAYVVLLVIFAARLLRRRANTATSTRLASAAAAPPAARRREIARATPGRAAWAALQAGTCAVALYALCVAVDGFFDGQTLPDGYSARNIAVTLRTIGRGLAYLLTFIFAANAVGLAGLAVQLIFYPEPEDLYAAPASGEEGQQGTVAAEGAEGSAAGQPTGDGQGPPPPAAPS